MSSRTLSIASDTIGSAGEAPTARTPLNDPALRRTKSHPRDPLRNRHRRRHPGKHHRTRPEPSGPEGTGAGLWLLLWQRWRLVAAPWAVAFVALLLALVVSSHSGNAGNSPPFLADGADIGPFQMGRTLAEVEKAFGPPEAQHSITAPDSANGEGVERQFISQQRSLSGERVTLLFAHERYFTQPNSTNYTETPETKLLAYCTDSRRFHLTGNIKIGQTLREVQERFGNHQIIDEKSPSRMDNPSR